MFFLFSTPISFRIQLVFIKFPYLYGKGLKLVAMRPAGQDAAKAFPMSGVFPVLPDFANIAFFTIYNLLKHCNLGKKVLSSFLLNANRISPET
jgi:hypothetical protein